MEERIALLEAQRTAYGLAIAHLVAMAWSDKADRNSIRELCCSATEAMYEGTSLTAAGHQYLQTVLHELEELFQLSEAAAVAIQQD